MTMGKKRGFKIALIIILLLVANAGAFAWIGVNFVKEKLDKVVKLEVDKSKLGIDPRVARELKNYRNIVLLGIDTRDVKDDKDARSDTIVIASIDKRTNKVRLTSVYRDCCLMQEQRGPDKINHAYFYGGPSGMVAALNRNLDLNIEEFVVVNWGTVANAIDAIGGLDINIKQPEVADLNHYALETARFVNKKGATVPGPGKHHLNGVLVTAYCRIRHSFAGDYTRAERTRTVIKKTLAKVKHMPIASINNLANMVLPMIKTNMSTSDMMGLAISAAKFDIVGSKGWPYAHKGGNIGGVYYDIPVTLKTNVIKLHEKLFSQKNYNPTNKVLEYDKKINAKAGTAAQ